MTTPRLRSVLYVPGANERALDKARALAADALILDLEDSVAPEAKPQARGRVCELVRTGVFAGPLVAVRINGIGSSWHDEDLDAVASARPDALLVPKVQTAEDVIGVDRALARRAGEHIDIWAMLETPLAVLRALDIATASDRLRVLVVGTNDLMAELQAQESPDRQSLQTSLGLCLLAARASGRLILDGVFNDVSDPTGFEAECVQARQHGFDGKTLIHPGQIDGCNRLFSPSQSDIEHARQVIAAHDQAARAGVGVATLNGRLIESLHVHAARRVLADAGAPEPST